MDARELLGAIFSDLHEQERIFICALIPDEGGEIRRRGVLTETIEEALISVERLDSEKALGVYFGICPRDARGGVARATCAWADVDAKNFESKAGAFVVATEAYAPPCSFLVDTGNGYHAYWLLSDSVPGPKIREVSKQIQLALNVDPVFDPTRILRVPGTTNRKHKDEPKPVQVRYSRPHLRYSADDLIFISKLNSKSLNKIMTGDQRGFRSRSERDWAVVTELARLGVSEDMIFTIFQERLIGDKYRSKGGGDTYLEHTIARAQLRARTATPGKTFIERDDALWIVSPDGGAHMVATFTYDPVRLLEGDVEDVLIGEIRASDYSWENVPLPKSAFGGAVPLLRNLPVAAWQWLGSDREVRNWLPWLMAKLREKGLPYAKATGTIGRHGEFWVTGDRTFTAEADYSSENAPVVYLRTGRESPRVGYVFPNGTEYKALLIDIFTLLPRINEPSVVWPILGWFMATPIKPQLESVGVRFPVLNVFGTRGSGKCLREGTQVCLADGTTKNIERLWLSNTVMTGYGTTQVAEVFDRGIKDGFEITTRSGHKITCTAEHKFVTLTKGKPAWTQCKDLEPGRRVAVVRRWKPDLAAKLDPDLAAITGWMIAEGCLSGRNCSFTNYDADVVSEVQELCEGLEWGFRKVDARGTYGLSKGAREWFDEVGLYGTDSYGKFIPEVVFRADDSAVRTFLSALWRGDGSVYLKTNRSGGQMVVAEYTSMSRRLIYDLQRLLGRFGILSYARQTPIEGRKGFAWRLIVVPAHDVRKFGIEVPEVGMNLMGGGSRLDAIPYGWHELLKHSGYWFYKKTHNRPVVKKGRDSSPQRVRKFAELEGNEKLLRLLDSDIFWDEVVSIEPQGPQPMYDIEVADGRHAYVAEGFVTHNTSTILRVFQPLVGYTEPRSYDCNTTPFVLLSLLSSSNSVPVSFSEFRRSTLTAKEYSSLLRYILLAYDVGHDPRGRPDQTTTDYPLSAPFTLDGEDSLASAAAKERAIVVNLSPEDIVEGSEAWQAFNELVELPLQQFAGNYVRHTLGKSQAEVRVMFNTSMELVREAFPSRLPDRVRRNITVCCVGLQLLTELLCLHQIKPPVLSEAFLRAAFAPVLDEVVAARTGRTLTMVDEFVQDVINQVDLPEERKPFFYRYDPDGNVLWFHLATALNWWYEKRRRSNQEVLESAAIKRQLKERSIATRIGPGQYVIGRKGVAIDKKTRWSYGVDLDACLAGGLDVPSKLTPERIVIFVPVQSKED